MENGAWSDPLPRELRCLLWDEMDLATRFILCCAILPQHEWGRIYVGALSPSDVNEIEGLLTCT